LDRKICDIQNTPRQGLVPWKEAALLCNLSNFQQPQLLGQSLMSSGNVHLPHVSGIGQTVLLDLQLQLPFSFHCFLLQMLRNRSLLYHPQAPVSQRNIQTEAKNKDKDNDRNSDKGRDRDVIRQMMNDKDKPTDNSDTNRDRKVWKYMDL